MSSNLSNSHVIIELENTDSADTATVVENFCEVHAGLTEAADLTRHTKTTKMKPVGTCHNLALIKVQKLKAINARFESQVADLQVTNTQLTRANEYLRKTFHRIVMKALGSTVSLSDSNEAIAKPGTFNSRRGLTVEEAFGVVLEKKAVTTTTTGFAKERVLREKSVLSCNEERVTLYEMFKE